MLSHEFSISLFEDTQEILRDKIYLLLYLRMVNELRKWTSHEAVYVNAQTVIITGTVTLKRTCMTLTSTHLTCAR